MTEVRRRLAGCRLGGGRSQPFSTPVSYLWVEQAIRLRASQNARSSGDRETFLNEILPRQVSRSKQPLAYQNQTSTVLFALAGPTRPQCPLRHVRALVSIL